MNRELDGAGHDYRVRAADALRLASTGTMAAIAILVLLFAGVYVRLRKTHVKSGRQVDPEVVAAFMTLSPQVAGQTDHANPGASRSDRPVLASSA